MAKFVVELGSRVGPTRRARGWTQKQLACAVGVSRQTIVELEQGNYNPSTALALRLATILQTTVETLFQLSDAEVSGLEVERRRHEIEEERSNGDT